MKKVLEILYPENIYTNQSKISDNIEKKIVEIAAVKNPRDCYQLSFSTWSLRRVLAGYISNKELNLVDHKTLRLEIYS